MIAMFAVENKTFAIILPFFTKGVGPRHAQRLVKERIQDLGSRKMLCSLRASRARIVLRASLGLVCRQNRRLLHSSTGVCQFNKPVSGYVMPRSGGIATTFRLPLQENSPQGLDACFVGIPMDTGASNRSGTRLGEQIDAKERCGRGQQALGHAK